MKYTVIASHSARGDWNTIDTKSNWGEAWALCQGLKKENPRMTYHIV